MELIYNSEKKANKALKVIGKYIIAQKQVQYIAVVKTKEYKFKLEIGTLDGKSIDLKQMFETLLEELSFSTIKKIIKTIPYKKHEGFRKTLKTPKKQFNNIETTKIKEFTTDPLLKPRIEKKILKIKKDSIQGGTSIKNKEVSKGTLGGIFMLEGFPDEYFGISNWHVIAEDVKLGAEIICPDLHSNDKEVGILFWENLDEKSEVAFVHFDKKKFNHLRPKDSKNTCGYKFRGNVKKPKTGIKVKKCGFKTRCNTNDGDCSSKAIYSSNATVKINGPRYGSKNIFTNQILIKDFSDYGDSGSLLVNKNNEVLGLIFCRTIDLSFTVANNINHIFNSEFKTPQKVMDNQRNYHYLNQFKLKKFIY